MKYTAFLILAIQPVYLQAFAPTTQPKIRPNHLLASVNDKHHNGDGYCHEPSEPTTVPRGTVITDRRRWMQQGVTLVSAAASMATTATTVLVPTPASAAAGRPPLDDLLYTILRVREATEQESRLIKTGKFKDVQRANVKLAVRFMVENYRLADAFVAAAAYLDGNERRIAAGDVGQAAVQNLITILEYFDSADVQNLKVSGSDGCDNLVVVVVVVVVVVCVLPLLDHSHVAVMSRRINSIRLVPIPCRARRV